MSSVHHQKPQAAAAWDPTAHYLDQAVAEDYDRERFSSRAADIYLALERHYLRKAFAGLKPGTLILDAPCGTGRLAKVLLDAGYEVVGADISPAMLKVAQRRLASYGGKFTTVVCDARELATLGRRFEAALCARVLMHFPLEDQIKFLGGVAAVTDGRVVFTQCFDSAYQRFRRSLKRLMRHQEPANYPISREELAQLLYSTGLRPSRRYHLFPTVSEAMVVVAAKA